MAWIKSHQNLLNHPKVLMLCQKTNKNKAEVIGILHIFWWWVLDYAENGDLLKYGDEFVFNGIKIIDLKDCGFIDSDYKVHDWLDYSGKYLTDKYRTHNPKKLKSIVKKYGHDHLQTTVSKWSRQKDKTDKTDKKDKTEDKKTQSDRFEKIWIRYPRREGKRHANIHFIATVKTDDDWMNIKIALENYKEYIKEKKYEGKYIKMASTWFNNWQDWVKPPDAENEFNPKGEK